jgi:hypothetical protein
MLKNYLTWHKAAAWMTLLTGCVHSLNFFSDPQPQNETEKQLLDLMDNYKMPLPGFERSMSELVLFFNLNMSFFLIGWGLMNLLIARHFMPSGKDKIFLWFNFGLFTLYFAATYLLTFLLPLIMVGLCWALFGTAVLTHKKVS